MAQSKRPLSLWRNRDYLLLWSGQLISNAGSGISQIAFPLLVLAFTGSPVQAGLVSALNSLIYILCILPAGALLDRWNSTQLFHRAHLQRSTHWSQAVADTRRAPEQGQ